MKVMQTFYKFANVLQIYVEVNTQKWNNQLTSPPRWDLGTRKVCGSFFTAKPVSSRSAQSFFRASNRSRPLQDNKFHIYNTPNKVQKIKTFLLMLKDLTKVMHHLPVQSRNLVKCPILVHNI